MVGGAMVGKAGVCGAEVTVVIPVYNGAAQLPQAVASVQAQMMTAFELVIVDDGSTDDSTAVAGALASADPRIAVVTVPANAGRSAARNAGIAQGSAPLVSFLDVDDAYDPRLLEAVVQGLSLRPDLDAVRVLPAIEGIELEPPRYRAVAESLAVAVSFRRPVLDLLGGWPDRPLFRCASRGGEDVALMVLFNQLFRCGRIELPLYRHRHRPGGHLDRFIARSRIAGDRLEHLDADDSESLALSAEIDRLVLEFRLRIRNRLLGFDYASPVP